MDALTYAPNGRMILVVDDDARALQTMSDLLEFEGFSVSIQSDDSANEDGSYGERS
jgi:CheY-like chemotaxis protein